jgi:hypothetical protein
MISASSSEFQKWRIPLLVSIVILMSMIWVATPVSAASAGKNETNLSITLYPENPQAGEGFTVSGVLTAKSGEILGNKYVFLDSTKAGAEWGTLQTLWQTKTNTTGGFSFYRPPTSPAEVLRVRFDGTTEYSPSASQNISIKK